MRDGGSVAGHVERVDELELQLLRGVEVNAVHLKLPGLLGGWGSRGSVGHHVGEEGAHMFEGSGL